LKVAPKFVAPLINVTSPWVDRIPVADGDPGAMVPVEVTGPTVPEPPRVPLVILTALFGCGPLTSRVPEVRLIGLVNAELFPDMVTVPPWTRVVPVTWYVPWIVSVPPVKLTVPAPPIVEAASSV
jgi:hypothetical protein